jgi:pimeloyl-ACP methyl ester carboxylesterase
VLVEAQVEGRTVTFRHEPGERPTLVFLHGASSNHRIHDRMIEALPGWNRISLNLPGRAGADGPPLETVASMAAYVRSVARAVVDGPYVLVGYSLGGAVALEQAMIGDDRLIGLVLIATGARLRVDPTMVRLYELACDAGGASPALPAGVFEDDADPTLIAEASECGTLTPAETAAVDWGACDGFDRMNEIGRIEVPALIVGGSDDVLAPAKFSEFLATGILESELHILEGAGHMMVMERAKEIAPLIASFVSRL